MSQSLPSILEAARQLPANERLELAQQILKEIEVEPTKPNPGKKRSISEETFGSIKGLDRATLIHLVEDEEFCGY